jgi:hypothetical protein
MHGQLQHQQDLASNLHNQLELKAVSNNEQCKEIHGELEVVVRHNEVLQNQINGLVRTKDDIILQFQHNDAETTDFKHQHSGIMT